MLGGLLAAASADLELAASLAERNERRREALSVLAGRILGRGAEAQGRKDLVDLLFVLTSFPVYESLSAGRGGEDTQRLIQAAAVDALARARH